MSNGEKILYSVIIVSKLYVFVNEFSHVGAFVPSYNTFFNRMAFLNPSSPITSTVDGITNTCNF